MQLLVQGKAMVFFNQKFLCWIFFGLFCIHFKVTKVTTGHQNCLKLAKKHNKFFFLPQGQKNPLAEGRSPPQELEVGLRSGP